MNVARRLGVGTFQIATDVLCFHEIRLIVPYTQCVFDARGGEKNRLFMVNRDGRNLRKRQLLLLVAISFVFLFTDFSKTFFFSSSFVSSALEHLFSRGKIDIEGDVFRFFFVWTLLACEMIFFWGGEICYDFLFLFMDLIAVIVK